MVLGCDIITVAHFIMVCKSRLSPAFHLNGAHDLKAIAVITRLAGFIGDHARISRAAGRRPEFVGTVPLVVGGADVAG